MNNPVPPQTKTTPAPKKRLFRRWWHWLLAFILLVLLYGGLRIAYEENRAYFPRPDLPAFDQSKVAALTPEKRAAYEQELFSQLQQWNQGSRQYPTAADIGRREQRWQAMADDGFELAHITLSVLKPEWGRIYSLSGPMKRLEALAKAGDVGAMCLMPGLVGKASLKQKTEKYEATYKKWMEQGALLGHPECQKALGGRLLRGVDGYSQDFQSGMRLIFAARRAGYAHDAGALILHYQEKGFDDLTNVRRLYCWLQIEDIFWYGHQPEWTLAKLKKLAMQNNRPELLALHNELQGKQNTLQDCVKLGSGE